MATGGQSLGGAVYTVTANTAQFQQGMQQAQQQAVQTSTQIVSAFSGLQIVPRQLAAINQSIVSLGNSLQGIQRQAAGTTAAIQGIGRGAAFGGFGGGIYQISAFLDDIQYGFRSVVNQVPMLATTLGSALGLGAQQAMVLGGAIGIIAVGINQVTQHWNEWFGAGDQLPKLTQDVEQLGRALQEINGEIDKLIKKKEDADKPSDLGNLFGMTKETFTKFDQERLNKAKQLRDEAKKRIKEERDLEATGPEHTKEAGEVGGRVREAIGKLPEGSDTLMGILQARGMSREQAREAISQATRGHTGYLNDILGKLTPDEKKRGPLSGLAGAMPRAIEAERQQKIDEEMQQHDRADAQKRMKEDARKKKHDQQQALGDQHRLATRGFEDERERLNKRMEDARKQETQAFKGSYFEYATSHGDKSIEKQKIDKLESIKKELEKLNDKAKEERRKFEDESTRIARMGE